MKHLLTILLTTLTLTAQAQSYLWSHGSGGTFPAATGTGSAIATDVLGNVYFLGSFSDSVDFDSSPSSTILVSNPIGSDLYISKYDSSSNLIWAKQITGLGSCYGTEIMVEGDHLCISGYFSGSFDFDPTVNDSVITSNGIDVFIAKYDTIGNFKWVRSIGGPTNSDKANGLAVDSLCNFYVTGVFEGTVDFNPDTNINNLSPISSTGRDLFVAKYDSSGNYVWAFNINSTYGAVGRGLITDVSGIIVTGLFTDTADFDPGGGVVNLICHVGGADSFFAKYDFNGNYQWAHNMNINVSDISNNNIGSNLFYLCGNFSGTNDFNPGAANANITSNGTNDLFFACYDGSGNYILAKGIGDSLPYEFARSITTDNINNIYITGEFRTNIDLDPGIGIANFNSIGGSLDKDIFFAKYDANGNYLFGNSIGSVYEDEGDFIAIDKNGAIYITGFYTGVMDCDPNNGVANVYPSSSPNFFYAKYSNIITNVENISNPQDYEFTAYPNPTIDFLNLHIMQNCTNCFYTLQFIDISGKVVFQNTYNKEDISINIENLTSGTYLITINSTSLSMSKIFIKK